MGGISQHCARLAARTWHRLASVSRMLIPVFLLLLLQSCTLMGRGLHEDEASDEATVNLADVGWIFGEQDCEMARKDPEYMEWQQVRYQHNTFIFRQNKCSDFEAPFVYLLIGADRALLIDTGATVAGGDSLLKAVRNVTGLPLTVAHSHGHGDHTQGDSAFATSGNTLVVGTGAEAVQEFFGFSNWPNEAVQYELGRRALEILPIPGHTDDDLAFHDPLTGITITGDTLYPGRLYVRNWDAYRASIARLNDWLQPKAVTHVLGTHIEISVTPDLDYPVGTTYQPDERQLPLSAYDIARLHDSLRSLANPEKVYLGSFIVWPVN